MVYMANCKQCLGTVSYINNTLVKCDYCGKLYSVENGELVEANKALIYESAVSRAKSKSEKTMQEAIELFDALDAYKDSEIKMIECKEFVRKQKILEEEQKIAEMRRVEKEAQEEKEQVEQKKKKLRLKRMCIACAIFSATIIVGIVGIAYAFKKNRYEKAMEFYEQEQYEDALKKFDSLGGFKDSEDMVTEVSNLIAERNNYYEQGVSYYNNGLYEKALEQFVNILSYADVLEYIENASNKLYSEASALFEKEEYIEAREKLNAIPEDSSIHVSAQSLLVQTEEIIAEQERAVSYEAGIKYYEEGQYNEAQKIFVDLGEYEDVQTYLSAIGKMYYSEALELCNAGNYVECASKLESIDTVDEWNEYTLALELKQQITDTYYNLIMEEAKSICRSEGDATMVTYLESMVCSIFTEEDVEVLKETCHIERISLNEIEPYVTGGAELNIYSNREDTLGNIYSYALYEWNTSWGNERSNTYYLGGNYVVFSATVAVSGGKDNDRSGIIRIYGDGKLLWSDENIRANTKPYFIEIDITGVEDLKIEMYGTDTGSWSDSSGIGVLLGEPVLSE